MKFSQLLQQRDALLRQARLANVAFAHEWLRSFVDRGTKAGLQGSFVLRDGDLADGLPWPTLTAVTSSQSVVEEHFLEEDVVELADILAFVDGARSSDRQIRLEEIRQSILPALRRELEEAGVPPQEVSPTTEGAGERA